MIDQGDRLYPGNPLRFTHQDDLLITYRKETTSSLFIRSSFTISYQVEGDRYAFWEQPFIGKSKALWTTFVVAVWAFVICCPFLTCYFCVVRPCCCKQPICCSCRGKRRSDHQVDEKTEKMYRDANLMVVNKVTPQALTEMTVSDVN